MIRFRARFTPEAWIRDNAVEVDAEGPQEWDCTAFSTRAEITRYVTEMRKWFGDMGDGWVLDASDIFKDDPAAPEWVRRWQGPFTIWVREEEIQA